MHSFWLLFVIFLFVGLVWSSFYEWSLHKFLMHRPLLGMKYAFRAHAVVHHQVFKADDTYHLQNEKDKETIPMAWWNGPVIILTCAAPFALLSWFLGNWGILAGVAASCAAYYVAYERIHWCMHLPKERRMEASWIFRRLNGHHLLHHRYMHKNFNVVLPIADLCCGTLMLRSKIRFAQAMGPSVPDMQPRG